VPKLEPKDDEPMPFELRRYTAIDVPYTSTWHTIAEVHDYRIAKVKGQVSGNLFQYFEVHDGMGVNG
jgi:hypothetical protein